MVEKLVNWLLKYKQSWTPGADFLAQMAHALAGGYITLSFGLFGPWWIGVVAVAVYLFFKEVVVDPWVEGEDLKTSGLRDCMFWGAGVVVSCILLLVKHSL